MTLVVAPPTPISTSRQPDPRYFSSLDDLVEYLEDHLDPDQVLDVPFDSYTIEVSADGLRRSRCHMTPPNHGHVALSLQPAQDVATMVRMFQTSEVWPARVSYQMFEIVRQILVAQGWLAAGRRVDQFVDDRLAQLITTHLFAGESQSPAWANPRRNWSGIPDAAALFEQLAAFQIFHELGHLIGWRTATRRGEPFSVETEQDEVNCDRFACDELWRAYGDDLELLRIAPVSCFFGVLIWTLADHLGRHPGLDDAVVRERVFSIIVRRARAATLQFDRFAHRFEAPSPTREARALRYFPGTRRPAGAPRRLFRRRGHGEIAARRLRNRLGYHRRTSLASRFRSPTSEGR